MDILKKIFTIRGVQVMLDRDLAQLYGVTTGNLNLSVKRNINRFTQEFCFKLTDVEFTHLRLHFESANISSKSRSLPTVFKTVLSGKMTQLSQENLKLKVDIHRLSDVLDQFEKAYLIIKRPNDGDVFIT